MEIFEPANFFQMANLIANLFTGLIAVSGLLIALATYYVAKEALGVWKKEKAFDIDIEGYAKSIDAIKILEDLKIDQYNPEYVQKTWGDVMSFINSKDETEVYRSFVNLFSYSEYFNGLKERMFEMRKQSLKVFNVSTDPELIDFYDKYITVEANIYAIHHNYHYSKINQFIDQYNYKEFAKEKYAVCLYFNAIKVKEPQTPDNQLYQELYDHFFKTVGGDPIDGLRQQQVSFFYHKLKKNR